MKLQVAVSLALVALCAASIHENARTPQQFCDAYNTTCGYGSAHSPSYANEAACLNSINGAQHTLRQCYKYHLTVAEMSQPNADIHCPHTAGAAPCTLGESFCWFYGEECTFDNANENRWDSQSACEAGWAAATGSQRECMHYHLAAAQASDNAVHCNHAAQKGGLCEATAQTFCDAYAGSRALASTHDASGCVFASTNQYASEATCKAKWEAADKKGTFDSPIVDKAAGQVTQRDCIEYHLFAAWTTKLPTVHCPHAAAAAPCDDAKISTGTPAPNTTKASSGPGATIVAAAGVLASAVAAAAM